MENPIKMDDLGVSLFLETPKCCYFSYFLFIIPPTKYKTRSQLWHHDDDWGCESSWNINRQRSRWPRSFAPLTRCPFDVFTVGTWKGHGSHAPGLGPPRITAPVLKTLDLESGGSWTFALEKGHPFFPKIHGWTTMEDSWSFSSSLIVFFCCLNMFKRYFLPVKIKVKNSKLEGFFHEKF